jgi:hypothetical protein
MLHHLNPQKPHNPKLSRAVYGAGWLFAAEVGWS